MFETIISRNQDPFDVGVVSVSQVTGGATHNVIPNDVKLKGTMRSGSTKNRQFLRDRLIEVADQVAKGYGCEANRFRFMGDPYPAVTNDQNLWDWVQDVAKDASRSGKIEKVGPYMFSEDFAFFSEVRPSLFMWLGIANLDIDEDKAYRHNLPTNVPLHNSKFNIDERILARGVALHCLLATESLEELANASDKSEL